MDTKDFLQKYGESFDDWSIDLSEEGFYRAIHRKTGIWVDMVQMSIAQGYEAPKLITFRRHYPRFVHSEALKHRMHSISAESSRARPWWGVLKKVWSEPAKFGQIGVKKKGMRAGKDVPWFVLYPFLLLDRLLLTVVWLGVAVMGLLGIHKQVVNRYIERWMMIHDVVTATDYDHFYNLRIHPAVEPTMRIVATAMFLLGEWAYASQDYEMLSPGEWHVPFVRRTRLATGRMVYSDFQGTVLSVGVAKKVSAVSCAKTSYRRNDAHGGNYQGVWDQLIVSKPPHATPVEHQATPMNYSERSGRNLARGVLLGHLDNPVEADQALYSGNFKLWHQHRKEIEGEKFLDKFVKK